MTNAYNLMQNLSNEARCVIAAAVIVENGFTRSLNDARTAVAGSAERKGRPKRSPSSRPPTTTAPTTPAATASN